MAEGRIPLPHLVLEIERRTGQQLGISYTRLWSKAVAGEFPATLDGKRWYVLEQDLPATIAALGAASPVSAA